MTDPWKAEIWRVFRYLLGAVLLGLLVGNITLMILIVVLAYTAWNLYQLYHLEICLRERQLHKLPDAGGVWGDLFHHIYMLNKRNRERKKRLATLLSRFKESTEALPDGTLVLTQQWEISWYNKAAQAMLGLKSRLDVGQRIDNLIRDPLFIRYLSRDDFSAPLNIHSPNDEQVYLTIRVIPYARNQRLMVVRDVTRVHQLEQMRRDFVSNLSHELRTPLTVINGYLETMSDSIGEIDDDWQPVIEQMHRQVHRMDNIVGDLLLLSEIEMEKSGQKQGVVRVAEMLDDIRRDALILSGERQHSITLDVDEQLFIKGYKKDLLSAFSNLIYNAVRYTPDKGEILIRWYQDDQGAHFSVKDNGPGIARYHIHRLTERFYRVDEGRSRNSGGTGLGLAIVKHALYHHNTVLDIQSILGQGSTFSCLFPLDLDA